MAGTLPGVEAARRRRTNHRGCGGGGGGWSELNPGGVVSLGWTRRPVFCLFVSRYEPPKTNPISSSSVVQRSRKNRVCHGENHGEVDESLGKIAREAKERLDERLRAKTTSHITRNKSDDMKEERTLVGTREVRSEVFGCRKNPVMRWASKLGGWKASEQEECAVCLERFKAGNKLVSLPCAHRFHSSCLFPWLQGHAHCPCCRFTILT